MQAKRYRCPDCQEWYTARTDGGIRRHLNRVAWPLAQCKGSYTVVAGNKLRPLTAGEVSVINLASQGLKDEAIARKLGVSLDTVRDKWRLVYRNTGACDRTHAVAEAIRRGTIV